MDARRIENRTIREKDPVWKTSYPESPFTLKLAAARAKSSSRDSPITNPPSAFLASWSSTKSPNASGVSLT